ncbi:FAD-binding oxidoreductase [Mangrovitalea sediminis]|uniref:FAD-binding oxidoreductase n=1 Tax=Mangrovitalea sediminis TaxID=1982043 RepID=UPI000BE4EA2F|nr:FAD-binding oxidoreductase [Mangrovitalea sediminis]
MPKKVTLANGNVFDAGANQTILEAAAQHGVALEHSCRTGRCGVCKAEVICGETEAIKPEESLTEQEKAKGFILTCCRSASSDIRLDLEDLGELGSIQVRTLPCRIDKLQPLSSDVIEVTLRTPPNSHLEYLPGQYVDMIGKDGLRRSYSLANAPREDGKITLQIRKVQNGQMSHYWFNEAQPNDLLRMEGPLGTFCLRQKKASHLLLLATGTGIAPIKAILEQLSVVPELNAYRQVHLYWGGRTEQDIYWQPEFPELPLKYTPVLSRGKNWHGRTGHVQQVAIADGIDLKDAVVYACGSEAMIRSAHEQLTAAGLNTKHFYSDAFVSSN